MSDTLQEREDQAMNNDDFCDECHSYKHMPWCSSYTEPDIYDAVAELREQQATSEHQPAARDGGDYFDDDEVKRHLTNSRDCRHGSGFTYDFCPIVNRVNQHQALVAEREWLETLLNDITTRAKFALSTPGFIRDRDGLQKAVDAIEQRSTSE